MMTSRTSDSVAGSVLLFMFVAGLGCTASRPLRPAATIPADSTADELIVDPWSLGPDVFARLVTEENQSVGTDPSTEQTEPPARSVEATEQPASPVVLEDANPSRDEPSANVSQSPVQPKASTEAAPVTASAVIYTVQLGTFLDRAKAQEFYDRASTVLGMSGVVQGDWPFYRLRFGNYMDRESADSLHRVAMSRGFYDARILKITAAP